MLMKILTPILVVVHIAWALSAFYFVALMARWFFETDSWYTSALGAGVAFFVMMIPFGSLIIMGLLFYFLAFVEGWNVWLTIFYICPGALFFLIGSSMEVLDAIFKRRQWSQEAPSLIVRLKWSI